MAAAISRPLHGRDLAYPLAARESRPEGTIVEIGGVPFGGRELVVVAGPCAVETAEQVHAAAQAVAAAGARVLRGGAFKPRTSPYAFQGLGVEGLLLLAAAGRAAGLPVVTEVLAPEDVDARRRARRCPAGRCAQRPELRAAQGPRASRQARAAQARDVDHDRGTPHGCGVRALARQPGRDPLRAWHPVVRPVDAQHARPRGGAVLAGLTHLPVVIDPSHGAGRRDLVAPLAKAGVAAGADGLIIEVHPDPDSAWSDGAAIA